MLTFKRKLILTKAQANRLDSWMGVARLVYNMCIEIRKEAYKNQQITIHRFALDAQLKDIREIDWVADVPYDGLSNAIKRVDLAYKKFFSGGGFPRFRNKRDHNSISLRLDPRLSRSVVTDRFLRLPKIGDIKMVKDTLVTGKVKMVTIKKQSGAYYACITTDAVKSIQNKDESQILALDAGIARFMTGSDGSIIENPRHFKKYEKQLRIENRSLSRKKRFGKNWQKQAKRLSKLHSKIAAVRNDFIHKESTKIAKKANVVILEDLNVAGMAKNRNLSKHILDVGWGIFRHMLEYKTEVVTIDPAYTSQTCYDCGTVDKKSRISQSEFICTSCGAKSHADENAARNILRQGMAVIAKRKAIA